MNEPRDNHEYSTGIDHADDDTEVLTREKFFADLYELHSELSKNVYESGAALYGELQPIVDSINQQAAESGILDEHVRIIGKSEDILHPYMEWEPDTDTIKSSYVNRSGESSTDTISGHLSRFAITAESYQSVLAKDEEGNPQQLDDVFIPRISSMVYAGMAVFPDTQLPVYYKCKMGDIHIDFTKDRRDEIADEAIETINGLTNEKISSEVELLLDELYFGDDGLENGTQIRMICEHIHKILNKSASHERATLEDLVLEIVNMRIPSDRSYNIAAPYMLSPSENSNFDFVRPKENGELITHRALKPLAISCLPRSYVSSNNPYELVVNKKQKALYMSFLDQNNDLYHIPLASIKELLPRD